MWVGDTVLQWSLGQTYRDRNSSSLLPTCSTYPAETCFPLLVSHSLSRTRGRTLQGAWHWNNWNFWSANRFICRWWKDISSRPSWLAVKDGIKVWELEVAISMSILRSYTAITQIETSRSPKNPLVWCIVGELTKSTLSLVHFTEGDNLRLGSMAE